jgi:hypothetical protein
MATARRYDFQKDLLTLIATSMGPVQYWLSVVIGQAFGFGRQPGQPARRFLNGFSVFHKDTAWFCQTRHKKVVRNSGWVRSLVLQTVL